MLHVKNAGMCKPKNINWRFLNAEQASRQNYFSPIVCIKCYSQTCDELGLKLVTVIHFSLHMDEYLPSNQHIFRAFSFGGVPSSCAVSFDKMTLGGRISEVIWSVLFYCLVTHTASFCLLIKVIIEDNLMFNLVSVFRGSCRVFAVDNL